MSMAPIEPPSEHAAKASDEAIASGAAMRMTGLLPRAG
jgi:hypothetical protein